MRAHDSNPLLVSISGGSKFLGCLALFDYSRCFSDLGPKFLVFTVSSSSLTFYLRLLSLSESFSHDFLQLLILHKLDTLPYKAFQEQFLEDICKAQMLQNLVNSFSWFVEFSNERGSIVVSVAMQRLVLLREHSTTTRNKHLHFLCAFSTQVCLFHWKLVVATQSWEEREEMGTELRMLRQNITDLLSFGALIMEGSRTPCVNSIVPRIQMIPLIDHIIVVM